MSHTPGPWKLGRSVKHGHPIKILGEDRTTVAFVPEDDSLETPTGRIVEFVSKTGKANAALIAAAPELLAACKAALERIESDISEKAPEAQMLRAAIAKARGES